MLGGSCCPRKLLVAFDIAVPVEDIVGSIWVILGHSAVFPKWPAHRRTWNQDSELVYQHASHLATAFRKVENKSRMVVWRLRVFPFLSTGWMIACKNVTKNEALRGKQRHDVHEHWKTVIKDIWMGATVTLNFLRTQKSLESVFIRNIIDSMNEGKEERNPRVQDD